MRICQPPENASAGLSKSAFEKPRPFEHLRHAQVDAEAVVAPEEFGQVVIADEQGLVFAVGQRRVGQGVLDAVDLGARVEERRKRERSLIEEAAPACVRGRPAAGSQPSSPEAGRRCRCRARRGPPAS